MVMWMSAALAAIAFSLAVSVRGETDHTSTTVDDLRTYYLATGALERAVLDIQQGGEAFTPGQPRLTYKFPTGDAIVDLIPETAKLNINYITADKLMILLNALGVQPEQAAEIAQAIVDWRTAPGVNGAGGFDGFYESQSPSFHARHASFEEIEELLSVKGVTPDIYYGTYVRDTSTDPPQLVQRGGLKDCLSVYGVTAGLDANGAAPAAMIAADVPADVAAEVVARRPFLTAKDFGEFLAGHPGVTGLRMGGNKIFTLRATAHLRAPDGKPAELHRTVAETLLFQVNKQPAVIVMRWYDRG
jgi:general secretion pathway protein K